MEIHTQGGTVVTGDIRTNGGNFIGRDQNIYNFMTEVAYDVQGLPNPYLGLRSFTYADRDLYAGRDDEIKTALEKLTLPGEQQTLLFVTGASGSGKSSFVQAGLVPALEEFYNKRHLSTQHSVFRPSVHPLALLKDALLQLDIAAPDQLTTPTKGVNLLVIDQFEELFTQSDPTERMTFCEWLASLPAFEQAHTHVIATIRSDYLHELAEVSSLWLTAKDAIVLRTMSRATLQTTIQHPLQVRYPNGEKRFEKALVDRLASDTAGDPTFLPLLQVTLEEIWRKGKLVLVEYNNLTDALRQRADQVVEFEDYNTTNPQIRRSSAGQIAILNILLNLVRVSLDDNAQRDVRVSRLVTALENAERSAFTSANQRQLINDLVNARLLSVTTESGVETANIIHEALIRNWARLQKAIAERRQELQQRARFEQSLHEWLVHEHRAEYLLQGVYLAEARKLDKDGDVVLRSSDEAEEFLRRSLEQAEAEQRAKLVQAEARLQAERKTVVRTRWLLVVAIALVAVLGVPVAYRELLRQQAIHLTELQQIPASTVVLGYEATQSSAKNAYLPHRRYNIPAFQIEKYEVTNLRYNLCLKANACSPPNAPRTTYESPANDNLPVVNITALQANQFCGWIGRTLPTDYQWERAARYTDERIWPWTKQSVSTTEISLFANFQTGLEADSLKPVGSFPKGASAEGVQDLAGNAWEWTKSPYTLSLSSSPQAALIDLESIEGGITTRGGGANLPLDNVDAIVAYRNGRIITTSTAYVGFRCVSN